MSASKRFEPFRRFLRKKATSNAFTKKAVVQSGRISGESFDRSSTEAGRQGESLIKSGDGALFLRSG